MREIKYKAFLIKQKFICDVLWIDIHEETVWVEYAPDSISFFPFDEVEIMQFTWLLDKNGKEIYEGDVVRVYNDDIAQIVFKKCIILWKTKSSDYMLCNMEWEDFEVIWTIYENPELIK